jgi:hypothetical protein
MGSRGKIFFRYLLFRSHTIISLYIHIDIHIDIHICMSICIYNDNNAPSPPPPSGSRHIHLNGEVAGKGDPHFEVYPLYHHLTIPFSSPSLINVKLIGEEKEKGGERPPAPRRPHKVNPSPFSLPSSLPFSLPPPPLKEQALSIPSPPLSPRLRGIGGGERELRRERGKKTPLRGQASKRGHCPFFVHPHNEGRRRDEEGG